MTYVVSVNAPTDRSSLSSSIMTMASEGSKLRPSFVRWGVRAEAELRHRGAQASVIDVGEPAGRHDRVQSGADAAVRDCRRRQDLSSALGQGELLVQFVNLRGRAGQQLWRVAEQTLVLLKVEHEQSLTADEHDVDEVQLERDQLVVDPGQLIAERAEPLPPQVRRRVVAAQEHNPLSRRADGNRVEQQGTVEVVGTPSGNRLLFQFGDDAAIGGQVVALDDGVAVVVELHLRVLRRRRPVAQASGRVTH